MVKSSIAKRSCRDRGRFLTLEIGRRLRILRRAAGLTQREVGRPFTGAYISAIERGHTAPSLAALAHLAARLGVSLAEFFEGVHSDTTGEYTSGHEPFSHPPPRRRRSA